jgi:hypothetical protein
MEVGEPDSALIAKLADKYDAEIYLYSAPIDHKGFGGIVKSYNPRGRKNALLILTTNGGLANSAYKIARFFQTQYEDFIVAIPSVCKSAGTLVACGATRLIMTPFSELGPLDVQLSARDEIGLRRSGLLNHSAFEALKEESFGLYEHFLLSIIQRSDGDISFAMASNFAAEMAANMTAPIFEQIAPDAIGSDYRDLQVAVQYGRRLALLGGNIDEAGVEILTNHYPSHDFIIDRWEAEQLFSAVEPAPPELWRVASLLEEFVFSEQDPGAVVCLTNMRFEEDDNDANGAGEDEKANGLDHSSTGDSSRADKEGGEGTESEASDHQTRRRPPGRQPATS